MRLNSCVDLPSIAFLDGLLNYKTPGKSPFPDVFTILDFPGVALLFAAANAHTVFADRPGSFI